MGKLIPDTSFCFPLPGQILGKPGASVKGFNANNYVRQELAKPNASYLPTVPLREMEDKEHSLYIAYTFADQAASFTILIIPLVITTSTNQVNGCFTSA